jgi:hypothetical protein
MASANIRVNTHACALLAALVWLALSLGARADDAPDAYFVADPALSQEAERWLAEHAIVARPLAEPLPARPALSPAELAPLDAAEEALIKARALAAQFSEGEALRLLVAAEQALREHLELPHAHAFLAELYVQTALVSASLPAPGLVQTSLRRAASLDPQRSLQAGEASPEVLALARAIERARDSAAPSRVRVEVAPEGATVRLDGSPVGRAPCLVVAPPGLHTLIVEQPGHHTYAVALELESGERAPIVVALSPTAAEQARRTVLATPAAAPASREALAVLTHDALSRVWLFERAPRTPRATDVYACSALGCVREGLLAAPENAAPPRVKAQREQEHKALWRRWPLWVGVALAVGAATTTTVLLTRDERTRSERVLTIDPGSLPDAR